MNKNKFNLLLKNPILASYNNLLPNDKYVLDILDYPLCIPQITHKPFIFSCFVLSVDGKLYYPDQKSGYNIARCNSHATTMETQADLFTLMLARSISDAIIIGTNSINNENGSFLPDILYPELQAIHNHLSKSQRPTTFIMCRDLTNINFDDKLFSDNLHQVIICCMNSKINLERLPDIYNKLDLTTWVSRHHLKLKNLVRVNDLQELILKLHQIGFSIILNESPYFHHQLLQLQLLDEVWLNYSGSYIGGNLNGLGGTQYPFNRENHPDCEILTLHSLGYNFLYTRQKILYP